VNVILIIGKICKVIKTCNKTLLSSLIVLVTIKIVCSVKFGLVYLYTYM